MTTLITSTQNLFRLSLLLGILVVSLSSAANAQDPAPNGNNGNSAVVMSPSNSYVKEGIIFAILAGAAIFSVCRSSPRGL